MNVPKKRLIKFFEPDHCQKSIVAVGVPRSKVLNKLQVPHTRGFIYLFHIFFFSFKRPPYKKGGFLLEILINALLSL